MSTLAPPARDTTPHAPGIPVIQRRPPSHPEPSRSRRLARLLWPAALALPGFVSTELTLLLDGRRHHPDVALVRGDTPADGLARRPPLLVIDHTGAIDVAAVIAGGCRAVWLVDREEVAVVTETRTVRHSGAQLCKVPWLPAVSVPASALLAASWPLPE